ncbi:MAG: hypothetical protein KatS3mg053_3196 [Candidatus Roseilinea sp.]|nr:MAG: hypothetical protein KatS3mg053_3196 [Candidatus Roseilinea sp.]
MSSLGSQLQAARLKQFVGRDAEIVLFRAALDAEAWPFYVLHVFGPGGVGKTFLLKQFAALASRAGVIALYIDGRNIEPTSIGLTRAVRSAALAGEPSLDLSAIEALEAGWSNLRTYGQRFAILVDTYETLMPLDGWLHDELLLSMPENTLLVLAGRRTPSLLWRTDPLWNTLVRALPLRNFEPEESRAYLARRNVPAQQHMNVLAFTHGHPLALSLVAETFAQRRNISAAFQPEETPDVVRALLERFVQKTPSPAHRAALEACALVRALTEDLLCRMLNVPEAHELFEWLRDLSFIDAGRFGLFPHDLAREAIAADVRWRNPEWYTTLHKRARTYYNQRLQEAQGSEQQRVLFDFTFLHRDNPIVRQYVDWQESGVMRVDLAGPSDGEAIVALVRDYEGETSAACAAHWLARQPEGILVLRESNQLVGYLICLALEEASEADWQADPVAAQAWAYVRMQVQLRPGERVTLFRFWGARDGYQQIGAVQSLIFVSVVQYYLTTPRLAYTLFTCADPDFWEPLSAYADLERVRQLEWDVKDKHFGVFVHDWRARPPAAWLELMAEREMATHLSDYAQSKPASPVIALSEPDFKAAVRDALRQMSRSQTLRGNPLLGSRMVTDRAGQNADDNQRIAALKALIAETAEGRYASPRDVKLYRAFYHTYLKPAVSQEQAAEILNIPFSTYRRHLYAAIERITESLCEKELGE